MEGIGELGFEQEVQVDVRSSWANPWAFPQAMVWVWWAGGFGLAHRVLLGAVRYVMWRGEGGGAAES